MINEPRRLFLLIVTNAGGEGKTFVSLIMAAVFSLLGEKHLMLDTDPGNKAASSTGGGARYLDPLMDPEDAMRRITGALDPNASLLIDAGANMLSTSREFETVTREVAHKLNDDGHTVRALWMVSTNKLGVAGSATRGIKLMDRVFAPLLVFNDRDGSGTVPDGITPDVKIEHLQPGLVSLVNAAGGFATVIENGIVDHQHSADMIAAYVWRFVDQPPIRGLLGDRRVDHLRPMLDRKTLNVSPYTLRQPTADLAIERLASKAGNLRLIDSILHDRDAIIEVLQRYTDA